MWIFLFDETNVRGCYISIKAHWCHDVQTHGRRCVGSAMGKILLLKTSCPQLVSETKFLGRLLIKTERGFLVKPLAKLFDSLLSCAGAIGIESSG